MRDQFADLLKDIHEEVKATRTQVADLRLETSVRAEAIRNIERHLAVLNGSVARHEEKIGERTVELLNHAVSCPLRTEVAQIKINLNEHSATAKAASEAHATWMKFLAPLFWGIVGAVATLVLLHSQNFLRS